MKLIAFYLPQFHEIEINNRAWGNGFTEWTNVKKAKPLFLGHRQPRVPEGNNYYNLLDEEVIEKQTELAKTYGVYGFCLYHYWFNGERVLYKPAELIRDSSKINFPYCFAWANEPWTKTWHGAGGEKEILIRQTYGNEKSWEEHYNYLRSFFCDANYIKINNKPVFMVYKIHNMRHRSEMFEYFNRRALQDGMDGVFLIQMLADENEKSMLRWINGYVDLEPARYRNIMRLNNQSRYWKKMNLLQKHPNWDWWNRWLCDIVDYEKFNEDMLNSHHDKGHFRCVFVDYDDTPRRGKKGLVFRGSTPEVFGKYLRENIKKSELEGNELLFINAWNEWGEGNYLEGDEKYGLSYLRNLKLSLEGNAI